MSQDPPSDRGTSDSGNREVVTSAASSPSTEATHRKGPMSFLSGSLTSLLLAWISLGVSVKVLAYYAEHPPRYAAPIAQNIGTAVKTLVVGTTFLATFCFGFVGLGLFLVFLRSLRPGAAAATASPVTAAATDPTTPAEADPGAAGG